MIEILDLSLLVCIALTLFHFSATSVHRHLRHRIEQVQSLSGGAAAAYVFLHLLPELDTSHAVMGNSIYIILLLGFVLLYCVDVMLEVEHPHTDTHVNHRRFKLRIGFSALYSFILAYTMSENLPITAVTSIAYTLALGLHMLSLDIGLISEYGQQKHRVARVILSTALLGGWLLSFLTDFPKIFLDSITALMAGFIVYNVFGEELPNRKSARLCWFVFGAILYLFLEIISQIG